MPRSLATRSNKKIRSTTSAVTCSPIATGNGGGGPVSSSALIPGEAAVYTKMAANRTGRMIEGVLTVNIEGDGENGISQAPSTLNETFGATFAASFL